MEKEEDSQALLIDDESDQEDEMRSGTDISTSIPDDHFDSSAEKAVKVQESLDESEESLKPVRKALARELVQAAENITELFKQFEDKRKQYLRTVSQEAQIQQVVDTITEKFRALDVTQLLEDLKMGVIDFDADGVLVVAFK